MAIAFHADEPRHASFFHVNVEEVVRPEGAEGQPEEAEDADPRAADREPEGAATGRVVLA
jgi:hypothetical protein